MAAYAYLETGSTDPAYNLAFEEYVLENRAEGNFLILWQNDSTIVIGRNQNAAAEIDRVFVEEHGIRLVRRMTGGGAVYHDLGNLNYSFITDADSADEARAFTAAVVEALRSLGLDAEASGRNDILAGGRKVSGTASRLHKGRILFHGTLLFDADLEQVAGALRADPEKFKDKAVRSVRSRVGNIRPLLPQDMTIEAFRKLIRERLTENSFSPTNLEPEELTAIEALADNKYRTFEWNWGVSPAANFQNKRRFDGGTLEIRADIRRGRIRSIRFYGDYLALASQDELCEALIGCRFDRGAALEVLERFDIPLIFGAVTADEILDTLFS